jgi:hypothetical protein
MGGGEWYVFFVEIGEQVNNRLTSEVSFIRKNDADDVLLRLEPKGMQ